ncbi:hypothetical protein PMAYCL1PPCAC_23172, partial [Pristionchus mayeri]
MSFSQMPVYHYAIMGVGWPSIIIYLVMIVSILKNRHKNALLRSSFFNMVLAESIPELLLFLYVEFLMRTRKFGFLQIFEKQIDSWLVGTVFFGHNSLRYMVVLGFLPFAVNRFTALRSPTTYTKLWTLRFTLCLIFLCWVGGLSLASPIYFFPSANFSYLPNGYGGLTLQASNSVLDFDSISAISTVSVVFGVCSVIYLLSFLSLRRVLTTVVTKSSARVKEDFLLMLSSLLTFTTLCLDVTVYIIQVLAVAASNDSLVVLSFDLWFVTTELMCISQPWCLLCTNRTVRRYFLRLIRLRSDTSTLVDKVSRIEMRSGSNASAV